MPPLARRSSQSSGIASDVKGHPFATKEEERGGVFRRVGIPYFSHFLGRFLPYQSEPWVGLPGGRRAGRQLHM